MVNSVSSSDPRVRLQKAGLDANSGKTKDVAAPAAATSAAAVDGVELSKAAQAMPGGIEAGPPFDLELVSRIKEKIAEGNYPNDVDAITDSLFDSYRDLMS